MGPHSITGLWNPIDYMILVWRGLILMKRYPVSSHVKWNLSAVDYVSEAIIEIIIDTNHEQNELPKTFNINNPVDIVPMDDLISWSKEIGYELYYLEYSNWSKNLSSLDKSNPLYTLKEFFQRA